MGGLDIGIVCDDNAAHARGDAVEGIVELGKHTTRDDAIGLQLGIGLSVDGGDDTVVVVGIGEDTRFFEAIGTSRDTSNQYPLLVGASAQRLIFSAQRDTACALDHGKPSQLAPVHANLSCSSDPMANRQSLSLFSRQAPTVSSAEASPTPMFPQPCTMSPHSWEWRVP